MSSFFENADVIHSYSRKQMIADGFLVEVPTDLSRQCGFVVPVGILIEVWNDAVAWSK